MEYIPMSTLLTPPTFAPLINDWLGPESDKYYYVIPYMIKNVVHLVYILRSILIRRRAVLLIPCGSVLCVQSNFNGLSPSTSSL